jgi:hydrogenase expression/formation protein HypC
MDYVPEIVVGDYAIVHVGFAISKIDEATAQETLAAFRAMGVLEEELASEEEAFARAAVAPQMLCTDGSCTSNKAGPSTPVAAATSAQDDNSGGSAQ